MIVIYIDNALLFRVIKLYL